MTKLSVNINKIATLRNSRGQNNPCLLKFALDCESYGADGITVHPRPDERHIKYKDVVELKEHINTELNVEGFPSDKFIQLIEKTRPNQVTLVPDAPDQLTSNKGWDIEKNNLFLNDVIDHLHKFVPCISIFIAPEVKQVFYAKEVNADKIELYTKCYADLYESDDYNSIKPYIETATQARKMGLGINAGHDLNLRNLNFFFKNIIYLDEVSIGHALVCDLLYFGIEKTILLYKNCLNH